MSTIRCKQMIVNLKRVLAQSQPFSEDTPVLPLRVIFAGGKRVIRNQMKDLREKDPDFDGKDESELVEQFVNYLYKIHNNAGKGYRTLDEARATVVRFCEMYPLFRPKDFYVADAYDEKFPVDIAEAGQQEIPLVTQPHQMVIPDTGVEEEPISQAS